MSSIRKEVMIVGDHDCDKSNLILVYIGNVEGVSGYISSNISGIYASDIEVDDKLVELTLQDTTGTEDYDRLRHIRYRDPGTDVILICFTCDNLNTLESVSGRWMPEVRHFCPKVPVILVCTKLDLRDDPKTIKELAKSKHSPVKWEEGYSTAEKIGAYAYCECSAKTGEGVKNVFEMATRAALLPEKIKRKLENKNLQKKFDSLKINFKSPEPKRDPTRPRFPWRKKKSLEVGSGLAKPNDAGYETLLTEAMQGGYVECNVAVILMIGVAGAGKTSFLQLVFNRPPLKTRKSTPLAKCAIRAVSISRAAVSEEGTMWKEVTPGGLLEMVGDSITDTDTISTAVTVPAESSPVKSMPTNQSTEQPQSHHVESTSTTKSCSEERVTAQVAAKQPLQDLESLPSQSLTTVSKLSYEKLSHVKSVRHLIMYMKKSNRSGKVFERNWVYVADCGGQPQFIDLIPSYIRNVSGAAIFVKLNEELGSQPEIAYYSAEGKLCGKPYLSSLTHMQTIQNCLQVMQSRHTVSGEVECPHLFFIGTHRDHERSCKENLESKNKQLLEMLLPHESVSNHLSYYRLSKPEQLLYPVNAKKPKPKDREVAREFREDVMKKCRKVKMRIPLRWFILEQQLQHTAQEHNSAVLSLEDCQKVASDLEIDRPRLLAAIDYLDRLSLFKYLPEVLPNVVFTTSQVLLDKVSDLVELSHCLRGDSGKLTKSARHVSDEDLVRFRDHGIVNIELLNQFPKHYVKGLFTSDELIIVLTNQLVFARNGEGIYFMPCVLLDLLLQKLSDHRLDLSSAPISPLLVYYLDGLFPASIFNSLVAFLQNRSLWKVAMKQGQPACLYKNCVKFTHLKCPVTLTLIYSFDYMEVHAHIALPKGLIPANLCLELLEGLIEGLLEAAEVQNYTNLEPNFGFFCSCEASRHSPHLASFNPDNPSCLCCSKDNSCFRNVTEPQQVWLDQLASIMNDNAQEQPQTASVDSATASKMFPQPPTANVSSTIAPEVSPLATNITLTSTAEMTSVPDNILTSPQAARINTSSLAAVSATISQIQVPPLAATTVSNITTETPLQIDHKTQLTTEQHYSFLCDSLDIHAAKWKDIGRNLQFLPGELANIEARPILLQTAPKSYLHAMMEEWLQWAPGDHRGSKNFATLEALQLALSKSRLGAAATELHLPSAIE